MSKWKTDTDSTKPSIKRASDFNETGEYDVMLPDGTMYKIYRDAHQFSYAVWYEVGNDEYGLGYTKKEALAALMQKRMLQLAKTR